MLFVLLMALIHRRWEEMWKVNVSYVSKLVGNVPQENAEKRKSAFSTSFMFAPCVNSIKDTFYCSN